VRRGEFQSLPFGLLVTGYYAVLMTVGCAVLMTVGCAPSRVAEHMGEAQHENVARMVENPEAESAPAAAITGLDPLTGEAVVEKYEREQVEAKDAESRRSILELMTGSD
jgi:hypothetical protein